MQMTLEALCMETIWRQSVNVLGTVCAAYVGHCEWLRVEVGHSGAWTGLALFEPTEQLPERQTPRTFVHFNPTFYGEIICNLRNSGISSSQQKHRAGDVTEVQCCEGDQVVGEPSKPSRPDVYTCWSVEET